MGFGLCRVPKCGEITAIDYFLVVNDGHEDYNLTVCGMWRHYAEHHGFQPTEREREVVMRAVKGSITPYANKNSTHKIMHLGYKSDASGSSLSDIMDRILNDPHNVSIMFVENTGSGYSHERGAPDSKWIKKMDELLSDVNPVMYRDAVSKKG